MTRIDNQLNGKSVKIAEMQQDEVLTAAQIANFDRRLGIKSDWFPADTK